MSEIYENKTHEKCVKLFDAIDALKGVDNIFEGSVIKAGTDAGLPVSAISPSMRHLERLGALSIIQRGNGFQVSRVGVLDRSKALQWIVSEGLTTGGKSSRLDLQLRNLARQLGGLSVPEVMQAFDLRLSLVEKDVKAIRQLVESVVNGEATK